jgi:hypothetical protein
MHRIDTPNAADTLPAILGAGTKPNSYWQSGNPLTGTAATQGDQDFFNGLQEEVANVIEAAGMVLTKGNFTQLLAAIRFHIASAEIGGWVNKDQNSALDIWRRGINGSVSAGTTSYTADGWLVGATGAAAAWAQAASIGKSSFSLKLTGIAGLTGVLVKKRIESFIAAPLAGQNVTVQARIKNNSGAALVPTLTVKHLNASDNGVVSPWAGASTIDVNAQALQAIANGATGIVAYTFAAPAGAANGMEITFDFGAALNNANTVQISEVDLRATPGVAVGLNNSPPPADFRPVYIEAMLAQRYLPGVQALGQTNAWMPFGGGWDSATAGTLGFAFQTTPRLVPTGLSISNVTHFGVQKAGTPGTVTGLTYNSNTCLAMGVINFTGASGGTAGQYSTLLALNSAASIFFTGAEL